MIDLAEREYVCLKCHTRTSSKNGIPPKPTDCYPCIAGTHHWIATEYNTDDI